MASTHHHLYQFFQFIDLLVNKEPLKNGEGDWIKTLENKLQQQQHHLHGWVLSERERDMRYRRKQTKPCALKKKEIREKWTVSSEAEGR